MKIYLGADHAGFNLKEKIKEWLVSSLKFKEDEIVDFGALAFDLKDDYPDFCRPVAEAVANDSESRGIILGGSGQGEAMCANRVSGARAAVYYGLACHPERSEGSNLSDSSQAQNDNNNQNDKINKNDLGMEIIRLSREHNNANILSLGARFINEEEAIRAIKLWLDTPFSEDERHKRRIAKF